MSTLRQRKTIIDAEETTQKPLLRNVAAIDMFPKPKEDYRRTQTFCGAIISVVTVIIICSLVLWELGAYIEGRDAYRTELSVDSSLSKYIVFNIDISFPKVPCHELSLNVFDFSGTLKFNLTQNLQKTPIDSDEKNVFVGPQNLPKGVPINLDVDDDDDEGKHDPASSNFCGRCFLGKLPSVTEHMEQNWEKKCCNTCEDVLNAYEALQIPKPEKGEIPQCLYEMSFLYPGCNCRGSFKVRKIGGILVFSSRTTKGRFLIRDLIQFDSSHVINKFSIGDESVVRFSRRGIHYPLNGHYFTAKGITEVKYFLKIVPTAYIDRKQNGVSSPTYEYGVQWRHRPTHVGFQGTIPSVGFHYDFSPIQVNNHFERPSFYHFLVQLCGIVGGLFVVLGLIDGIVMRLSRMVGAS